MHLGNVFTALMSWLSVRSRGGKWILRIEDLDPQRSKYDYARMIEDDLLWLGLEWDEGGVDNLGPSGPYSQSERGDVYMQYLEKLQHTGYVYPCTCTRADIMATQAPHQSDGRIIYSGKCRPALMPAAYLEKANGFHAVRIYVPDEVIEFKDGLFGVQHCNLATHCGDFVLRRADGAWAYQLAVVVDDALMGITEVVRGSDLLLSTAQQIYLYRMFGFDVPDFVHVPLICNGQMQRLSKRDGALNMAALRQHYTAEEITGRLAHLAGLIPYDEPCSARDLISFFDWKKVPAVPAVPIIL